MSLIGTGRKSVSGDNAYTDGTFVYAAVEAAMDPASGDTSGSIVAVDGATGEEVWRSPELGDIGCGVGADDAAAFVDGAARRRGGRLRRRHRR
jgi:hypothetical protein